MALTRLFVTILRGYQKGGCSLWGYDLNPALGDYLKMIEVAPTGQPIVLVIRAF